METPKFVRHNENLMDMYTEHILQMQQKKKRGRKAIPEEEKRRNKPEYIAKYCATWYQKQKAAAQKCECGGSFMPYYKPIHEKTKKHLEFLKNKELN